MRSLIAIAATLSLILTSLATSRPALAVADPLVTGPIPATAAPGDPSHDYPFFASDLDLASRGYVEEEFFIQGSAQRYAGVTGVGGIIGIAAVGVATETRPYKTRIVVRRPASPSGFAGTVLVEWYNVTNNADMENSWFQIHDFVMRSGWAWVGVSAQRVGVNRIRTWSPTRYGTLDVSARNSSGSESLTDDSLSYDIYSQAAQAIRRPIGVAPLGPLQAQVLIATGHSQSAAKLDAYVNGIQPITHSFDAFAIHGSVYGPLSPYLEVPTWKVLSEYDVTGFGEAAVRRADADNYRSWEVAGVSHVDQQTLQRARLERRDFGSALEDALRCGHPIGTWVPFQHAFAAGLSQLDRWVRTGTPMTTAPWLTTGPSGSTAQRDSDGNILGGLRLPQMDVPIYLSTGTNTGPEPCPRWGYTAPFTEERLRELYPTHDDYVAKVIASVNAAIAKGWLLQEDGDATIAAARAADVPPDRTPPVITSLSASPERLWGPNHSLVPVSISAVVTDDRDPAPQARIVSVSSSEPESGLWDGDVGPDWVITGPLSVELRAERASKDGRTYTITVEARDAAGNASTGTVTVFVPHSMKS